MKASEVFDLPVSASACAMDNYNIYSASGVWCATLFSDEQAKVAANCINHADALADALADLIDQSTNYAANFKSEYYSAIDALEAYRGTK